MKIKTLLGINGYSLIVCHCSGNSYQLSIIERDQTIINFEGIYVTLQIAIDRGKSVIQNLDAIACTEKNKMLTGDR